MGFPLLERIQVSGVVGGTEVVPVDPEQEVLRQSLLIVLPPDQRLQFNRIRWNLLTEEDLPVSIHLQILTDPDIGSQGLVISTSQGDTDTFIPPFFNGTGGPVNVFINVFLRSALDITVNVLPEGSSWWYSFSRLMGPGP